MRVIDSHTEGEPTRVIVEGGPDLGAGSLQERADRLQKDYSTFMSAAITEPRGHDAIVGALLVPSDHEDCKSGVIYFNNAGNLGMCGHATLGLAATLSHLKLIGKEPFKIETPVGIVDVENVGPNTYSVTNVESYRLYQNLELGVPGYGKVLGDVAYGGNWFFLAKYPDIPLHFDHIRALTDLAMAIRQALEDNGVTGSGGAVIDHIEIMGPPVSEKANARNFVLCPGLEYDRSPCGTGSSAKIACLAADRALKPSQPWIQESIIGSQYEIQYRDGRFGGVIPTITGRAFVTSDATLLFDPDDPYRAGIRNSLSR